MNLEEKSNNFVRLPFFAEVMARFNNI